eukprot:57831-Prymnesium_polylepis.1
MGSALQMLPTAVLMPHAPYTSNVRVVGHAWPKLSMLVMNTSCRPALKRWHGGTDMCARWTATQ